MTTQDHAVLNNSSVRSWRSRMPMTTCAGRKVKDKSGNDSGNVHDVFVDDRVRRARFLLVDHDGLLGIGEKKSVIPVDAIRATTSNEVFINDTCDHISLAPADDPDLINDRSYQISIYGCYGYAHY
jgi:sporulation protein YlmC with PRC-barrel domain